MLKAIETKYKGYRFRSRLEARWAVFFDDLKIKWEYEPQGFDFGSIGLYLPDFWLPNNLLWIEIKGQSPTKDELLKAEYLGINSPKGHGVMIISGTPMEEKILMLDPAARKWLGDEYLSDVCLWCEIAHIRPLHTLVANFCDPIRHAYTAARSARFEHGECP